MVQCRILLPLVIEIEKIVLVWVTLYIYKMPLKQQNSTFIKFKHRPYRPKAPSRFPVLCFQNRPKSMSRVDTRHSGMFKITVFFRLLPAYLKICQNLFFFVNSTLDAR